MAKDEAEYKKLSALWYALVEKQNAEKSLQATNETLKNLQPEKPSGIPSPVKCTMYTDAARMRYEAPYLKNAQKRAEKKCHRVFKIKIAVLVVLIAAAIALIGALITPFKNLCSWCYDISFYKMDLAEEGQALTGVHLLALSVILLSVAAIVYAASDGSFAWLSIMLAIGGAIVLLVSLVMYWTAGEGFIGFMDRILGLFVYIPAFFVALFAYLVIILGAVGVPGLIIAGFVLYIRNIGRSTSANYTKPKINYDSFYRSGDYRQALKKDEAKSKEWEQEYLKLKKSYDELCQSMYQVYLSKKKNLENTAAAYRQKIADCNSKIAAATFIHSSYRNIETLKTIFYYINYNYADNIKEALNVWRDDEYKRKMLALEDKKLKEMAAHNKRMEDEMRLMRQAEEQNMAEMRRQQAESLRAQEAQNERRHQEMLRESQRLNETMRNISYNTERIKHDVFRATN